MSQDKTVLDRNDIMLFIDDLIVAHPIYTPHLRFLRDLALSALDRQGSSPDDDGLDKKLARAINSVSAENLSNTPDFILANFLMNALAAVDTAIQQRDRWYGIRPRPGSSLPPAPQQQGTDEEKA